MILDNFREITLYNMDEGTDDDSPQSEPVLFKVVMRLFAILSHTQLD